MCLTGVHLHILRRAVAKCAQGFIIPLQMASLTIGGSRVYFRGGSGTISSGCVFTAQRWRPNCSGNFFKQTPVILTHFGQIAFSPIPRLSGTLQEQHSQQR